MKTTLMLITISFVGAFAPTFAHNAWVLKETSGYKIVYGHEDLTGYNPDKVKQVSAFDVKGKKIKLNINKQDSAVALEPGAPPAWFLVEFDNGFWTNTIEGSKNVSKKGIEDYIYARQSVKYSKNVFQWSNQLTKPMGQKIEVVPLSKPPVSKEDSVSLDVQVYLDGKPAASLPVGIGHDSVVKTDASGKAKVKIPSKGPSLIVASGMQALKNSADADSLSLSGVLYLDLKE